MLNHEVCGQGIRVSRFTLCMLYPVRIVKWQSECIVLTASVARWLWPKSAEWCHEKLLGSAKGLVTNFQLKSAESSEIVLNNLLFLTWLNETSTVIQNNNFSSCTRSQLKIPLYYIFYCGLMVHTTDTRSQKVVSYTSAHITETVFAHDQHWEEQSNLYPHHSCIVIRKSTENG